MNPILFLAQATPQMSLSVSDFVKILDENRVLDVAQIEELSPQLADFRDGQSLAKHLVDQGWLTPYQAEAIITGNSTSLLVGDYRLLDPVGQGGMGQVFRAAHLRLGRIVALKMIRPQSLKTTEHPDDLIRRFQREARAVAQLLHPNIVILFDYNEINGTHFIAMEFVDGVDLARMVQTQGPLPLPLATNLILQAANGLQHAFEFGMVHRDIKPSNLLVTKPGAHAGRTNRPGRLTNGQAKSSPDTPIPTRGNTGGMLKILDMGLVRLNDRIDDHDTLSALTMQGTVIGTPDFIAPEQARDATKVDIRADLYSLGCTFYYLLTGRAPFPSGTSVEKLFKHQNEQPMALETIRPGTPKEIIGIVQRLMAKRPEGRFQTPAELADAITSLPSGILSGRSKSETTEDNNKVVKAAADIVEAERCQSQISMPTQMFSPESLILPAKKVAVFPGHKGYVTALEFSNDGRLLATGGIDGTLRMWDVGMARPQERPLDNATGLGELHHLKFSRNNKTLFAGSTAMDGHSWRWDWQAHNKIVRTKFVADEYRTSCFAPSPDGAYLAAGSMSMLVIYEASTSKRPSNYKGHTDEIRCMTYSPDGKKLFTAGQDKTIRLWEPGRYFGALRATYEGHADAINAIALSPDGSVFATSSNDGTIRIWDASGETTETVSVLKGHANGVRTIRFTSNGLLLSVADGGQIFLWELTEQQRVREWQFEKAMMHSIAVSPDCRFLATGHGDGSVNFFDLELMVGNEQPQLVAMA